MKISNRRALCINFAIIMQVYTSLYRLQHHGVTSVQDLLGLSEVVLVAVLCEGNSLEPAIGTCIGVQQDTIHSTMVEGNIFYSMESMKIKEGQKTVDWTDEILRSAVLLYDFELTKSGHLRKRTIELLKVSYVKIESNNTYDCSTSLTVVCIN